jgi:carotene epsilon-monooxygenase
VIVERVFCKCAERLVEKLQADALNGNAVNMEEKFSQLTLDVIGLSVFNYNFDSLTTDSPVIDAVYTALKEAEARSTDLLPYWKACKSMSFFIILRVSQFFFFKFLSCEFLLVCRLMLCVRLYRGK